MLKLGCTLPNLTYVWLHKSTDVKFYPFAERGKNILEEIIEDVVDGPTIVFTSKEVVNETFLRKSKNICNSLVGIGASQIYPYSICQPIPTGLYTRWDLEPETSRFTSTIKSRSFENLAMPVFQREKPAYAIENFYKLPNRIKNWLL